MHKTCLLRAGAIPGLVLAATSAFSASDYLLQIKGIDGEAADSAAPVTLEISSFSWGASNPSSVGSSGGGGSGKASMSDLSIMKSQATREASSGMATGKRTAAVADLDGDGVADAVAAAPLVGELATVMVSIRESPTKASAGATRSCATGKHIKQAVLTEPGRRYVLEDVVVTSCATQGGQRRMELKGHVTLIK